MTIDNENKSRLRDELLSTLSFFEEMNLEKIFLDIDQEYVQNNPELTVNHLREVLEILKTEGLVKERNSKEESLWIKVYPKKKNFFRRFLAKFF